MACVMFLHLQLQLYWLEKKPYIKFAKCGSAVTRVEIPPAEVAFDTVVSCASGETESAIRLLQVSASGMWVICI